jgi:glycine/D-amino acid oxidase-like deaminating enzyme
VDAPVVHAHYSVITETADDQPWIAADPKRDGVVIATGAGTAFKFAPKLGALIADAVEGRENHLLQKFSWRPEISPAPRQAG